MYLRIRTCKHIFIHACMHTRTHTCMNQLIAKVRDGFLAPLDIDMLCSACAALAWAQVFPEVFFSKLLPPPPCRAH